MGENTKIEWADHTFNYWWGCEKVSQECKNCYAEIWANRFGAGDQKLWGPGSERWLSSETNRKQPYKWNKAAGAAGIRQTVFCSSMSDWAEDRPELDEYRKDLFRIIRETPNLIWLLLTKRYDNSIKILTQQIVGEGLPLNIVVGFTTGTHISINRARNAMQFLSVSNIPFFLSCEPLLEDIFHPLARSLYDSDFTINPSWIIVGGESGMAKDIRPTRPHWIRKVEVLCRLKEIPFLFKQWGEWSPGTLEEFDNCPSSRKGVFIGDTFIKKDRFTAFDARDPLGVMIRRGKNLSGRLFCGQEYNGNPFSNIKIQSHG